MTGVRGLECWRGFGGPVTALCVSRARSSDWMIRSFVRNTHTRTLTHQLTGGNKIGAEGAIALAKALEQNATLEWLDLSKMIHVVKRGA